MRTKNSMRNVIVSLLGFLLVTVVTLVVRRIFLEQLGVVYLGVNSLLSNVISVLSLAELGFASAFVFSLYKPIAEKNQVAIAGIMNLYKKIYNRIAIFILIIGIAIIPLIYILAGKQESSVISKGNFILYYVLFLINSVSSYFMVYKKSLIIADQKNYITSLTQNFSTMIMIILQIIALYIFKSFFLFLLLQIIKTLAENILISYIARKKYNYLPLYKDEIVDSDTKKSIYSNVYSLLFHRVGGVVITGSISIVITALVNVEKAGIYANYIVITNMLMAICIQIFDTIGSSVGSLASEENREKLVKVFNEVFYINAVLTGVFSVGFYILINDFIVLWLGKEVLLSELSVILICASFYINSMRRSVLTFREALGIFKVDRLRPLIESTFAVLFSIILFNYIQFEGILLGYFLAVLLTSAWVDPYVLYKYGLKEKLIKYIFKYVLYFTIFIAAIFICKETILNIKNVTIVSFVIKGVIVTIITSLLYIILFGFTKESKSIFNRIINMLKRR
ncbi:putative oligosaccharide translocase [Alteracholeplasma palmae J233]|uniref:Putative oligosaccharide translocase n=1 Tax=Alteracholeplasma palmae (strain ATCC 49389 / J233) TaxID=1318466 RepID=U4KS37_ALTPJ|nr:oligosaccharide translocase [Alteracholeplasma palmae]CCV64691.1 putative oligosaccharide translocase [Alteracholeplasma palmae J233]